MALSLVTEPSVLPVSLDEIKEHLRIEPDVSTDNRLLDSLVRSATEQVENMTRRQLCSATWDLILDAFPLYTRTNPLASIELPMPPLQDVVSITYVDQDGVTQTMLSGAYTVDADSEPGRVYPAYGTFWPLALDAPGSVTVRFSCGWVSPYGIPESIRTWIKVRVATLYAQAESLVIGQTVAEAPRSYVDCLLDRYIVPEVV